MLTALICLVAALMFPSADAMLRLSDVRVHPETGDVIGTEVSLEFAEDDAVEGTLKHFEGSCDAEVVRVTGTRTRNVLSLRGTGTAVGIRLDGTLTKEQSAGRVRFDVKGQSNAVSVRLSVVKAHEYCR